jgi:carbamoyl-phosphate synthase large subunit
MITPKAKKLTLLISSAGRRVELIRCFRRVAKELGVELRVLATDMHPELSAACSEADAAFKVPRCTDPNFIPALETLCKQEQVNLIVPTIDTELSVLANAREHFKQFGTQIAVSGLSAVRVARNKSATADLLTQYDIPTPRTFHLGQLSDILEAAESPFILKPIYGSGSKGIHVIHQAHALPKKLVHEDYIAQELWEGREFTINAYATSDGRILAAVPHERVEVRSGEVSKGITRKMPELSAHAATILKALPELCGPFCYQAIVREDGAHVIFELNARFGGGYPLTHEAGAPFARWLIEEFLGETPQGIHTWQENLTMLRYDSAFFSSQ